MTDPDDRPSSAESSRRRIQRRPSPDLEADRLFLADLAEADRADDPDPVSDVWIAHYEEDLDRQDALAAEHGPLARAEPELFDAFQRHFVWPRYGGRRTNLSIVERKGHHRSWTTLVVPHRGHVRFRVERHLDPARSW
jgi:hypothetical protein